MAPLNKHVPAQPASTASNLSMINAIAQQIHRPGEVSKPPFLLQLLVFFVTNSHPHLTTKSFLLLLPVDFPIRREQCSFWSQQ